MGRRAELLKAIRHFSGSLATKPQLVIKQNQEIQIIIVWTRSTYTDADCSKVRRLLRLLCSIYWRIVIKTAQNSLVIAYDERIDKSWLMKWWWLWSRIVANRRFVVTFARFTFVFEKKSVVSFTYCVSFTYWNWSFNVCINEFYFHCV